MTRNSLVGLAALLGLIALATGPAMAPTFPIDYSDPASDVVRLDSTTGLCEVDAADNCVLSPNPHDVNIQWVRGRESLLQYNLSIEVRGRIRDYPNTSYLVNFYTDATNLTHWIVNYTNGALLLYTNASQAQRTDITGNATVWGVNPTAPNVLSLLVDKMLLGGPTNISASVNIDGTAIMRGDPGLGQQYSFQDFGWEVPGHPTSSPTLLHGHVYVKGTTTPIAGATIVVSGGQSVTTNAAGWYEVSLTPGTYSATASADGYASTTFSVSLALGQTLTRDVELERSATLSSYILPIALVALALFLILALIARRRRRSAVPPPPPP